MKRRLCKITGFGSNEKDILDNKGKVNKDFADDAIEQYFKHWEGFDFNVNKNRVTIGIEPTYQSDPLKIVTISKNKEESYIETGRAFGFYGTGVRSKTKVYKDYKKKSKFIKFVDKWHPILFKE